MLRFKEQILREADSFASCTCTQEVFIGCALKGTISANNCMQTKAKPFPAAKRHADCLSCMLLQLAYEPKCFGCVCSGDPKLVLVLDHPIQAL